jgi:autotransporter strand-loop-strand O-heptosyltransferase
MTEPTQQGPCGIRYDFNEGCRIKFPEGNWRLSMSDLDTGEILFDQELTGGLFASTKKYYVRYGFRIWKDGELVFAHEYDAADKIVILRMLPAGIGDTLAWIGHAAEFASRHKCKAFCLVRPDMIELLQQSYPQLTLLAEPAFQHEDAYATYKILIFYEDKTNAWQPCDYRAVGLCLTGAYILGLEAEERRPKLSFDPGPRPIEERYVCIAVQASSQNKIWNNPKGWIETVKFLKQSGYRVICIDRETVTGRELTWTSIPHGAEDQTGARPMAERARWLAHAEFFIGLSSGLSWLAWGVGIPVVMISGFTHPVNEFKTPFRIINWHACNSCSNDTQHVLDTADFFWCPRHKGTSSEFECTKRITTKQVIDTLHKIPSFKMAG